MWSEDLDSKIMADIMKNAKKCKKSKKNFASLTDRRNKDLYYLLTDEQLELILDKKKVEKEVWVVNLELDHEGEITQEVWKYEESAKHRIDYLNKNKAGVCEKYVMRKFNLKTKKGVKEVVNE